MMDGWISTSLTAARLKARGQARGTNTPGPYTETTMMAPSPTLPKWLEFAINIGEKAPWPLTSTTTAGRTFTWLTTGPTCFIEIMVTALSSTSLLKRAWAIPAGQRPRQPQIMTVTGTWTFL